MSEVNQTIRRTKRLWEPEILPYAVPYGNCPSTQCTSIRNVCTCSPFPQIQFPRTGINRDKQERLFVFRSLIRRLWVPYSPHWVRPRMLPGHMVLSGVVIMYRFLGCVLILYGDLWASWAFLGIRAARFTVRSMWGEGVMRHPESAGYAHMYCVLGV